MTDDAVADLVRELDKARPVLTRVQGHLGHLAESNAALHCADRVMYSPLHAAVTSLLAGIDHAIERHSGPAEQGTPETSPPASVPAGEQVGRVRITVYCAKDHVIATYDDKIEEKYPFFCKACDTEFGDGDCQSGRYPWKLTAEVVDASATSAGGR